MPLQNRVTPLGDIVADPHRGLFTGNRGIIHDPATKTLLRKRWSNPAWLICVCEFRGRRREVMGGRSWTELFFLDEATALAAGTAPTATLANGVLTIGIPAGAKGAPGTAGVGVKSISLTKDTDGNITGGTVTKTDNSTTAITVTTA